MSSEVGHAILIAIVYLALLAGGEIIFRRRATRTKDPLIVGDQSSISAETMRKIIHSASGLMALAFPFLLASHWTLFLLISGFVLLLIAGQKFNFTRAINSTKRDSIGDILFPVGVYCVFFLAFHSGGKSLLSIYVCSILILSIADSAAALVGTRWGKHRMKITGLRKSWEGSAAFAVTAFVIIAITLSSSQGLSFSLAFSVIIAIALALLEAVSFHGTDNITVPITAFFLVLIASGKHSFDTRIVGALAAMLLISVVSSRVGARRLITNYKLNDRSSRIANEENSASPIRN